MSKKLLLKILVVAASAIAPLMSTVSAYAWGLCGGFFHKRAVPAKLMHNYDD